MKTKDQQIDAVNQYRSDNEIFINNLKMDLTNESIPESVTSRVDDTCALVKRRYAPDLTFAEIHEILFKD